MVMTIFSPVVFFSVKVPLFFYFFNPFLCLLAIQMLKVMFYCILLILVVTTLVD